MRSGSVAAGLGVSFFWWRFGIRIPGRRSRASLDRLEIAEAIRSSERHRCGRHRLYQKKVLSPTF